MELQLPLIGQRISEVDAGFTATIRSGSPTEFELQIEGDLTLSTPAGNLFHAASGSYSDLALELEAIIGSTVTRADASEADGLSLEFDSGLTIHVPVHNKYESWGIVGLDGYRVICLPGGEFAIWSARNDS
ncbi:DUF6188 family protein [Nocardia sp. NPDC051756]|uniref:DUF6188 family protein n=1 Tax=Nocardia sp. NPDC051756 TaxID=3154751 RepID=UPI0034224C9F